MRTTAVSIILGVAALTLAAPAAKAQVYVKGELGYGWSTDAGITDRAGWSNPGCVICQPASINNLGSSAALTGGVGYRFNDWFRADATLGYRGWFKMTGTDAIGTSYSANASSTALLANGYVDVPIPLGPVKPFVTGGIGVAWNSMSSIQQSWGASSLSVGGSETDPSGSRTNFAWALGAGLSWPFMPNWTADLTYRYLDFGNIGTSAGNSTVTYTGAGTFSSPTSGVQGTLKVNEVALAIRYAF